MITYDIPQDLAKMSIDPCDENVSLESIMKRLDQVHTEMKNVHIKVPSDKREVNVAPLLFVVETSRINRRIGELSMEK